MKQITIRLDDQLHECLRVLSFESRSSMNNILNWALYHSIEDLKKHGWMGEHAKELFEEYEKTGYDWSDLVIFKGKEGR